MATAQISKTKTFGNYVNGQFRICGEIFDNVNPVDGTIVGSVVTADSDCVDDAVSAAREAFEGPWGHLSTNDRLNLMYAVADGIEKRFNDFVDAEIADTGKPLAQARTVDIPRGAANFRTFADLYKTAGSECFLQQEPQRALNYSIRKPLGVVGVISPWNLPLLLLTWKVAPAMAVGNAVVAKPSEETPGTAHLLAEVMHEAGVPAGAFNLVNGHGAGSTGEYLSSHPDIDAITFTGETRTGSAIMRAVSEGVKSVSFELGGKNAALVFADADFDRAVEGVALSTFLNCGQVCMCSERVYVERKIFNRFVTALADKARALRVGRPYDESTQLGPLISRKHRDKVSAFYHDAQSQGAHVRAGGNFPSFGDERDLGCFIEPTVFTGLPETSNIVQQEIFGPVCHVAPFDDEAEAIALANNTKYGLCASIWTGNVERAHHVAHRMETGIVWVNSWYLRDLRTPFGGTKLSGIGREGGRHSLDFYAEPTTICVKL